LNLFIVLCQKIQEDEFFSVFLSLPSTNSCYMLYSINVYHQFLVITVFCNAWINIANCDTSRRDDFMADNFCPFVSTYFIRAIVAVEVRTFLASDFQMSFVRTGLCSFLEIFIGKNCRFCAALDAVFCNRPDCG